MEPAQPDDTYEFTIKLVSPVGINVDCVTVGAQQTLETLSCIISVLTGIEQPTLVVVRGQCMFKLDQPGSTLLYEILTDEITIIIHSPKTITQLGDIVQNDSERLIYDLVDTFSQILPPHLLAKSLKLSQQRTTTMHIC